MEEEDERIERTTGGKTTTESDEMAVVERENQLPLIIRVLLRHQIVMDPQVALQPLQDMAHHHKHHPMGMVPHLVYPHLMVLHLRHLLMTTDLPQVHLNPTMPLHPVQDQTTEAHH